MGTLSCMVTVPVQMAVFSPGGEAGTSESLSAPGQRGIHLVITAQACKAPCLCGAADEYSRRHSKSGFANSLAADRFGFNC